MNKLQKTIVVAALTISGCSTEPQIDPSMIRIKNSTGLRIDSLVVGKQHYSFIDTLETTEYRQFDVAYRNVSVQLYSKDSVLDILAVDAIGETPLGKGYFTYILKIIPKIGYQYLSTELIKDH